MTKKRLLNREVYNAVNEIMFLDDNLTDYLYISNCLSIIKNQVGAGFVWVNYSHSQLNNFDSSCLEFEYHDKNHIDKALSLKKPLINQLSENGKKLLSFPVVDGEDVRVIVSFIFDDNTECIDNNECSSLAGIFWGSIKQRHRGYEISEYKLLQSTTMHRTQVGIYDWDVKNDVVTLSDTWKKQIGYHPREIDDSFEAWRSRVHSDDLDDTLLVLETCFKNKEFDYETEHRLLTKSGTYIWVKSSASIFYDTDGLPERVIGSQIDISELKEKNAILQAKNKEILDISQRYKTILETVNDGIIVIGTNGENIFINKTAKNILRLNDVEYIGLNSHSMWHHTHKDGTVYPKDCCEIYKAISDGEFLSGRDFFVDIDNNIIPVYRKVAPIFISGVINGAVISFYDISEQLEKEKALQLSAAVYENTAEGIMVTDGNARIVQVNKAFEKITGYSSLDVIGSTPSILSSGNVPVSYYKDMWKTINEHGEWSGELENRKKNGELFLESLSISKIIDDDGNEFYIGTIRDITEINHTKKELAVLETYDRLTGLYNKHHFDHMITSSLLDLDSVLIHLNLDRFKNINDSLGHEYGDLLLIESSRRIKTILGDSRFILSRVGGDEFSIFIPDSTECCIEALAESLVSSFSLPFSLHGTTVHIGISIGISFYKIDAHSTEELKKNADTAMHQAKNSGKGTYKKYNAVMSNVATRQLELENLLRTALAEGELEVHYQPQICMKSGELLGYEALTRWFHVDRGAISPVEFIPLAEETGIIIDLGRWVLNQAAKTLKKHLEANQADIYIAVNISAVQLSRSDLVSDVIDVINYHDIPAHLLELEITESFLVVDPRKASSVLEELKSIGVKISIDDFGTGYSSLGYLKNLPFDCIKIDQSFTRGLLDDTRDLALVKAILAMADGLDLEVVAEGVETHEQALVLTELGCQKGQGWYYGRPEKSLIIQ